MAMDINEVTIVQSLVPIIAIVMGIGVAMLGMWFDYRKKSEIAAQLHRERLAAIEKGMEPPPLPPELFLRRGRTSTDFLRRGLVWLFIGVAITAAMLLEGQKGGWFGLIPAAAGLANLVLYAVQGRLAVPPAQRQE